MKKILVLVLATLLFAFAAAAESTPAALLEERGMVAFDMDSVIEMGEATEFEWMRELNTVMLLKSANSLGIYLSIDGKVAGGVDDSTMVGYGEVMDDAAREATIQNFKDLCESGDFDVCGIMLNELGNAYWYFADDEKIAVVSEAVGEIPANRIMGSLDLLLAAVNVL